MTEQEIMRAKFRRKLILDAMESKFQDTLYEYLEESDCESMDELDEHVDEMLLQFESDRDKVRAYYRKLIDS